MHLVSLVLSISNLAVFWGPVLYPLAHYSLRGANTNTGAGTNPLYLNKEAAEGERGNGTTDISGNAVALDFLSYGFKLRDNGDEFNTDGTEYIYMAFSEMPFKYAQAS